MARFPALLVASIAFSFAVAAMSQAQVVGAACLTSVANGDYAGAVPLCEQALRADPQNEEIRKALETAQAALEEAPPVAAEPPAEE